MAQCVKDLALLWLWCRPAATALIQPLAWEPPYAAGAALKTEEREKEKKKRIFSSFFLGPYTWHMEVPRLGVESEL